MDACSVPLPAFVTYVAWAFAMFGFTLGAAAGWIARGAKRKGSVSSSNHSSTQE